MHPEVRFASAHALGALVESLGDELDWSSFLLNRLNTSREESELEGAGLGFAVALATVSLERRVELLEEVFSGDPVDGRQAVLCKLTLVCDSRFSSGWDTIGATRHAVVDKHASTQMHETNILLCCPAPQ